MTTDIYTAAAMNWLWLADTEGRERALVVSESGDGWTAALRRHFAAVDRLTVTTLHDALCTTHQPADRMQSALLPFDDAQFDCVVLPGFIGSWQRIAREMPGRVVRARIMRECRRVLRTGGLLVVSGRNPQWYGMTDDRRAPRGCSELAERANGEPGPPLPIGQRHKVFPSAADLRLSNVMIDAGFDRVQQYFADPSDLMPSAIIPACRSAARAFEQQEHTLRGRAPRLLTAAGLHAMAYPARIVMAFA